jgi:hypothetical protein
MQRVVTHCIVRESNGNNPVCHLFDAPFKRPRHGAGVSKSVDTKKCESGIANAQALLVSHPIHLILTRSVNVLLLVACFDADAVQQRTRLMFHAQIKLQTRTETRSTLARVKCTIYVINLGNQTFGTNKFSLFITNGCCQC